VQPRGAGAVKRQPPEQYHARLGAGSYDDAHAFEVGLEALRQKAGQKTPHQPMFEVHLHHIWRIGSVRTYRRLK
jgi:hypothetical protein